MEAASFVFPFSFTDCIVRVLYAVLKLQNVINKDNDILIKKNPLCCSCADHMLMKRIEASSDSNQFGIWQFEEQQMAVTLKITQELFFPYWFLSYLRGINNQLYTCPAGCWSYKIHRHYLVMRSFCIQFVRNTKAFSGRCKILYTLMLDKLTDRFIISSYLTDLWQQISSLCQIITCSINTAHHTVWCVWNVFV